MARYMVLIYVPSDRDPSPAEMEADMPRWLAYTESLKDAGVFVAGDPLHGVETATTVRERGGELQVTDGPFADTKEWLGGYYILDCPDLDTALAHAGRIPSAAYGSTEVRPIAEMPVASEA